MNNPDLTITKYRAYFEILEDARLPLFQGDLLKKMLSSVLKRSVCLNLPGKCEECSASDCLCLQIFQHNISRPLVISQYPPMSDFLAYGEEVEYHPGTPLGFDLTFIGKGRQIAPYFLSSLPSVMRIIRRGGNLPVGVKFSGLYAVDIATGNLRLMKTLPVNHPFTYSLPDARKKTEGTNPQRIEIRLQSFTLLKDQGEYIHKQGKEITFEFFIRRLLRRISNLEKEWCGSSPDRSELWAEIGKIKLVENQVFSRDWWRTKGRQNKPVNIGGYLGKLIYEGPNLSDYLPFLEFGQHIHIGSNCIFGLGKYELRY